MYDEPGSRTRLAWLRTSLATLAVCALLLRGLILGHATWIQLALVLACAATFGALAATRATQLHPRTSPAPSGALLAGSALVIVALAALGAVWIALGSV